jgi:ABC-2 type transport system permease protein
MAIEKAKPKIDRAIRPNYFNLVRELAITDFKLKYQGSVVGYLWSLAKPLAVFGVLYVVFTVFVRIPSVIQHFPQYLLLGIVLWSYFAESTTSAMRSIVDKGDLIRKVYFPRIVILLASSISALITLAINLVVVLAFLFVAGIFPVVSLIGLMLLIIELYLFSLGVALFLSALYVKFRDFAHIWEVALQLLFYASAIIYDLHIVPERFARLITLSPLTQIIQDARNLVISPATLTTFDLNRGALALVPYLAPLVLVILGYLYFSHTASRFAEEV